MPATKNNNQIKKTLTFGRLFDFYGPLLTERQQEIIRAYYYQDLSLAEIANNLEISRQAVYDHLSRAKGQLIDYEEKLELVSRYQEVQEETGKILDRLKDTTPLTDKDRQELKESIELIKSCL
ncbi:MAG: YlxM family DNA-binding protein [Bacillota bacterium]